jgi:type II secretion system protein G
MRPSRGGFTLIELLVVVSLIAILSAIALPNFLEAQTRSKVSRAKADMRTIAVALDAYEVDNNAFPAGNRMHYALRIPSAPMRETVLERISTPVAYLTTACLADPFGRKYFAQSSLTSTFLRVEVPPEEREVAKLYSYMTWGPMTEDFDYAPPAPGDDPDPDSGDPPIRFIEESQPALWCYILESAGPCLTIPAAVNSLVLCSDESVVNVIYDPTNGTISAGLVIRAGGTPPGDTSVKPGLQFLRLMEYQR